MARRVVLLISALLLFLPSPALAIGDWDADDVDGPLDLRWIGASFTSDGEKIRLTITFHDGFQPSAIVHRSRRPTGVTIHLTSFLDGYFLRRRDGRTVFLYGDFGSSCGFSRRNCWSAPVHFAESSLLRVAFEAIVDDADPTYEVRAMSLWLEADDRRIGDRTGWLDLGAPPGP